MWWITIVPKAKNNRVNSVYVNKYFVFEKSNLKAVHIRFFLLFGHWGQKRKLPAKLKKSNEKSQKIVGRKIRAEIRAGWTGTRWDGRQTSRPGNGLSYGFLSSRPFASFFRFPIYNYLIWKLNIELNWKNFFWRRKTI